MRRLRSFRTSAALLALLVGVAAVLPEAGHSLAHRHGHAAADQDQPAAAALSIIEHGHAPDDHQHADLDAAPPQRTPLVFTATVRPVTALDALFDIPLRAFPFAAHGLAPPALAQAPPPPARAPPVG